MGKKLIQFGIDVLALTALMGIIFCAVKPEIKEPLIQTVGYGLGTIYQPLLVFAAFVSLIWIHNRFKN